MSAFEFVLIFFAIIIGLGVSETIAGWADQIRARRRVRPYPLQLISTAFVLYLSIQYLWIMWIARDIEWTFPRFLGAASVALVLAIAARVGKMDTAREALPFRDQYFQNSPAVYSLLALFPILILLISLTSELRAAIPDPPNLLVVSLTRIGLAALYCGLALSKSERFHWVAIGLLWLAAIGFLIRLGPGGLRAFA
jgi:hypothetical protein